MGTIECSSLELIPTAPSRFRSLDFEGENVEFIISNLEFTRGIRDTFLSDGSSLEVIPMAPSRSSSCRVRFRPLVLEDEGENVKFVISNLESTRGGARGTLLSCRRILM